MALSLILTGVALFLAIGVFAAVSAAGAAAGKFTLLNLSTDPTVTYTLWAGVVGGIALTLATHGTDQFLVQRLLAARSAREAGTGLMLSGVLVFAQFALFLVIGAMLVAAAIRNLDDATGWFGLSHRFISSFGIVTLTVSSSDGTIPAVSVVSRNGCILEEISPGTLTLGMPTFNIPFDGETCTVSASGSPAPGFTAAEPVQRMGADGSIGASGPTVATNRVAVANPVAPPITAGSVDFPPPEGPITSTNSPRATSR